MAGKNGNVSLKRSASISPTYTLTHGEKLADKQLEGVRNSLSRLIPYETCHIVKRGEDVMIHKFKRILKTEGIKVTEVSIRPNGSSTKSKIFHKKKQKNVGQSGQPTDAVK